MNLLALIAAVPPLLLPEDDRTYVWPRSAAQIPGDTTPYAMPTTAPWNAPDHLDVPTPDGTGLAVHPSVVDFYDQPWNGHRFWMAFTPYATDPRENPCIAYSDDGYTWTVPAGLTNPIYPWSGVAGQYNSDTELVYDPDGDRLICYWREVGATDESNTDTKALFSTDGATWTGLTVVIPPAGHRDTLSPSVVRRSAADWWLFGIKRPDATSGHIGVSVYRSTDPLAGWTAPTFVPLPGLSAPWHADVIWDGRAFRMIASDTADPRNIWAVSSTDGYAWSTPVHLMQSPPAGEAWDELLYRPTITVKDAETFRVWYSSASIPSRRWIGYTQIPRSLWPTPPA